MESFEQQKNMITPFHGPFDSRPSLK
jgi:hypothetical protein